MARMSRIAAFCRGVCYLCPVSATTTQEDRMNSTKIGDTVQTITRQYASGDAACRAGDIAEAMATVDGISRAQTVDAIVSYLCLAGFVYDEADHLRASLQASL